MSAAQATTSRSNRGAIDRLKQVAKTVTGQHDEGCHGASSAGPCGLPIIAIVGNPNVGKSVTFNRLTGIYAAVSNYPGTTVAVMRSKGRLNGREYEVVDTPGMYALLPITEEERVARQILVAEKPAVVLHVVDAKNLERMLPFTLQLVEAGMPVVLNLNVMDEAERLGMRIDLERLSTLLGIPVVATVATTGRGIDELKRRIDEYATRRSHICC